MNIPTLKILPDTFFLPDFTELGVGIDEQGMTLWVQVFGRPQS